MTRRIRLFGGVALDRDGRWEPVESSRVESLLAYLALHREVAVPRQQVAFQLWPDTTDAQALTNLRGVLHAMRRSVPDVDELIEVTQRTLRWRPDGWEVDAAAFEDALAEADTGPEGGAASLQRAVRLYRGDLVPGCYDEWVLGPREEYRNRFHDALRRLASWHERRGEVAAALVPAERLLRTDPVDEAAARTVMRLYDAQGDRARALRVYHGCVAALDREVGVAPSAETKAAYDALLAGDADGDDAGGPAREAPFVGRSEERAALAAAWREAEAGRAALVLVTGEAGIGKTRLVEELSAWCARQGAVTLRAGSYAAEDRPAYGPVTAWLRAGPVRRAITRLDDERVAVLSALVPELRAQVSPRAAGRPPLADPDPRLRLWDAATASLLAVGAPLLLVADDVHWADPPTLQLLHYLLRTAPDARILVVATARDDELEATGPLGELVQSVARLDRCTRIELARLPAADTVLLAERLAGRPLPAPDSERLCQETEGNPLFVVEAVRAGLPHGAAVTQRVAQVIEARLAALSGPARELAGVAAAIGRDFSVDVLARASGVGEDDLVSSLDELWRRRLVRDRGAAAYDFSHDKIRTVAYAALGPAARRHHHLRIARALSLAQPSSGLDPDAAQVAGHYLQAGEADDAVRWYARAATGAQRVYAAEDAVRHLDRAVEVLRTLPASPERDRQELALLGALPAALASVEGYASARVSATHARCLELAEHLGVPLDPPLLWSLAFASLVRDDFPAAERFAAELRDRGRRDDDAVLVVEGTCLLGIAAFWSADLVAARERFDEVVRRYRPELRGDHLLRFGQDPEVVALARLANTWWLLGDPVRAADFRDRARVRAEQGRHPLTQGAALVFAGLLALDMDDRDAARAVEAELRALRSQATPVRHVGEALTGYVAVVDGDSEAGVARIRDVLAEARRRPAAPGMSALLGRVLLAACQAAGDLDATRESARRLLEQGGAARVWAEVARAHLDQGLG